MKERQTPSKAALYRILEQTDRPLSVADLLALMRKAKVSVNKTTAYRELERLMSKGEVSEVDFADGTKRYELTHGDHHHHAVCTDCRSVVELEIEPSLQKLMQSVAKQSGFTIRRHLVEFFGVCRNCAV